MCYFIKKGPFLYKPSSSKHFNPQQLSMKLKVNNTTLQDGNTRDMIFSVAQIISYLSQGSTLIPGTCIFTGTPSGVGFSRKPPIFLKPKDVVEITIDHLGVLRNTIENE
jgi:2-keto-4-pentenoate hydratase/2-oxohepta-3-ene-1,7-dioic acid hydratase in catechol pathway